MSAAAALGLCRSWLVYHGPFWRRARMRRFYARFIGPGDLCFDLGAHVGSRVLAWRALGARVVALEPQPLFAGYLRRRIADDGVTVVEAAVARESGRATLHVSPRAPTVSTLRNDWIGQVREDPGFAAVRWDAAVEVEITTLEALIARFGEPAFCKIDVEGAELDVVLGLTRPLRALSFEYLPAARGRALEVVDALERLGRHAYAASRGESLRLVHPRGLDAAGIRRWLAALAPGAGSGDVYAWLEEEGKFRVVPAARGS